MTVQYQAMLRLVRDNGVRKSNRTGIDTIALFGEQMRFDLRKGFPLLTTKKLAFRWIAEELFWFLSGSTNAKDLQAKGVTIWDEWATKEQCARFGREEGDLGPVYGHAWRNFGATPWPGIGSDMDDRVRADITKAAGLSDKPYTGYMPNGVDQIAVILSQLIDNPDSRRIILSGWDPKEADQVALPPCHTLTQFGVFEGHLHCQMYQRSADLFLGVPYNIASYALLVHMLCHVTGLKPGVYTHTFGDVHLYVNHLEQVEEQLRRNVRPLPQLAVKHRTKAGAGRTPAAALEHLLDIKYEHLDLAGYDPHPSIKAPVAV